MTGPGETRLKRTIKEVRDMGDDIGIEDFGADFTNEELDEGELWFADSLAED
jgi:hypothetical protein